MKCWTLRIVILLFLLSGGAIVNVAVAWGCALTQSARPRAFQTAFDPPTERDMKLWSRYSPLDFPEKPERRREHGQNGLTEVGMSTTIGNAYPDYPGEKSTFTNYVIVEHSAGLPLRTVTSYVVISDCFNSFPRKRIQTTQLIHSAWEVDRKRFVPWETSRNRSLPFRPIWPGFAINTVFYAAILFALCFGFVQGRRIIRLRRGRCPKCAYDLRGSESGKCPECGWRRNERSTTSEAPIDRTPGRWDC